MTIIETLECDEHAHELDELPIEYDLDSEPSLTDEQWIDICRETEFPTGTYAELSGGR